jgi:hypothetical protein
MKYNVAIIGGGPAGLIAAGRAGELGSSVVLLEKNNRLGLKLLATGGGRCNLTNFRSNRELADKFGSRGQWLLSGLSRFGSKELIHFFNDRGLKTKIEDEKRVFPESDSSQDVLKVLVDYLKSSNVEVKLKAEVKRIVKQGNTIKKIVLSGGEEIIADKYIIATGGKSHPITGSTGDAYAWLEELGHKIITPKPSLVPIILKEKYIKELEGLTLRNIKIGLYNKDKKIYSSSGSVLFTANGLSGPIILNISDLIKDEDLKGLKIKIDLFPDLTVAQLDKNLQERFDSGNMMFKNVLNYFVAPKIVNVLVKLSKINPQKKINIITKEERRKLAELLKELKFKISGLDGFEKAMITSGGVDLKDVGSKTMQSNLIENLYIVGEILDLNGPTGGYNLQLCWTTGYLAGESVQ